MTRQRPTTIEDVALRAGVSVATVSRSLRGLPNVAAATRERVTAAALELDYHPDPSATSLATGRSRMVAMAVPFLDGWYFAKVMAGAERVLAANGYDLLVLAVHDPPTRRRVLAGQIVKRADGLILVDLMVSPDEATGLARAGVEIVSVGVEVGDASLVSIDDYGLARTAVAHLVKLGHSRIALVGGQEHRLRFPVQDRRRDGYADELIESGVGLVPDYEVQGDFTVNGGYRAARTLLAVPERPTAIFALSDEMAFGALRAIHEAGLAVPEDLSIVGVDDHELSAVVGLTTVRQDVTAHGVLAAEMLLTQLSGPGSGPQCHEAATRLILRRTTGPVTSEGVAEGG